MPSPALFTFMLWFFMFMVIAGEWFAMWQSKTWNGQAAALPLLCYGVGRADLR
jgi:predicted small integral membrane protein